MEKSRALLIGLTALALLLTVPQTGAQETSGSFTGGSVKIGYDSRTCNSGLEGAIRYNSASSCLEYCDNSAWTCPDTAGGAANCANDSAAVCTLNATRSNGDPQFTADQIACNINILGVIGTYGISTKAPSSFVNTFTDLTDQATSTQIASNIVQITGLTCQNNVTISGTASAQFRICGDATCSANPAYGTSGTITNNQYLQLRLTTSGSYNTARTATPAINGSTDTWRVTTCDGTPNAYSFTDLNNQAQSTQVTSDIVQITGMTCASVPVTVSGAATRQFRVCGDATCSTNPSFGTSGNIGNNQYLQLRVTTSGSYATGATVTPNIGGVTDSWVATTNCDNDPAAFTFTDISGQSTSTQVTSNIVQITGMAASCPATVTISGGGSPEFRVCADATCSTSPAFGTSGSVSNNQYLQLRLTTSASNSTITTATPQIAGISSNVTDNWRAVTVGVGCDTTATTYTTAGTQAYSIPANCNSITVEAFGAGAAGSGSGSGASGGGGGSLIIRDSDSKVLVAGGGGGGAGGTGSRGGGGGGYAKCTFITAGSGQNFTAYIGGGSSAPSGSTGSSGGAVGGTAGTQGGNASASTYGGGGGGGGDGSFNAGNGGNSTYGGGGGGGKQGFFDTANGGTSTYGGNGGNGGSNVGQGGKTYLDAECTSTVATNGSAGSGGTGGAAANSGPGGGGDSGVAGGNGKIIITPAP